MTAPNPLGSRMLRFATNFMRVLALACTVWSALAFVPASAQSTSTFRDNGWWWGGASQSGTGFFFESQAATGFAAFFMYDDTGKAIWYASSGTFTAETNGSFTFTGQLQTYRGGQPASSNTPATPTPTTVGSVTISFTGSTAFVQLPGRSFNAQRFDFAGISTPALAGQPEVGWYWNGFQSGRGYAIEVQNNRVFMTMFHYNADGSPTWNVVSTAVSSTGQFTGDFLAYTGGQTLSGTYRPPNSPTNTGTFSANFSNSCNGSLNFPGNSTATTVNRFGFAVSDAVACRTPTPTPTGFLTLAQINDRCPATNANPSSSPDWTNCLIGRIQLKESGTNNQCIYEVNQAGTVTVTAGSRILQMTRPQYTRIGGAGYSKVTNVAGVAGSFNLSGTTTSDLTAGGSSIAIAVRYDGPASGFNTVGVSSTVPVGSLPINCSGTLP